MSMKLGRKLFGSDEQPMGLGVRSPGSPRESKVKGDMLFSEGMSTAAAFLNLNRCCAVWSFQRVDPGQIGWSEERTGRSKSIAAAEDQCSLGRVWNADSRCGECAEGCASYPKKCG